MGKVDYNSELCSTEFANIKSEKESESSSIDENEIGEKRHDVVRNNQNLKRTADIGLKDDLLNTFVELFPSQPSTKDTGEVANEPENIHLYAGSDSMSYQACVIEVITEERHFGTGDMDEDDILYRRDSDVKDHLMYNGAFGAKGSDIVAGTADIDSEENTGNKTREILQSQSVLKRKQIRIQNVIRNKRGRRNEKRAW
ncbi:hypothetical protein DPMN_082756 [Dreissena polymorpha]|uniref:Uncharacterized protein n=1 Tax=Dreissena polymorpha TaxID=45954 RepID=A0A9D3YBI9_DREPO|nr:hypothetical protein DPMN_082756 [Dreissena polymorpha]